MTSRPPEIKKRSLTTEFLRAGPIHRPTLALTLDVVAQMQKPGCDLDQASQLTCSGKVSLTGEISTGEIHPTDSLPPAQSIGASKRSSTYVLPQIFLHEYLLGYKTSNMS